jgi:hypothetical protein
MPDDLMTQVRALVDDGAAPLTLDELRGGAPREFSLAPRRRGPAIAASIGIAAALAIGLVLAGVALAHDDGGGVHVSSPGSGVTGSADVPTGDADKTAEVFMLLKATDSEVATVKADLAASPDVASYTFLDHDSAYREFAAVYSCDADAGIVRLIRPDNLPLSFRVLTTDPGGVGRLQASLKELPGVALVTAGPRGEDYACKSGDSTLGAAGDPPVDAAAARDAVVAAFTQAWDGTNSFAQRRAAMQNFPDTDRLVEEFDQARPASANPMRAIVGDVTFVTPERAEVPFHLEFGSITMPIDVGVAVLQDGTWKVDRETVCTMAQRVGVACAG